MINPAEDNTSIKNNEEEINSEITDRNAKNVNMDDAFKTPKHNSIIGRDKPADEEPQQADVEPLADTEE